MGSIPITRSTPAHSLLSLIPAVGAVLGAMVSIQAGAAIAKSLFPALGAEGTTALRLLLATLLLLAFYRPWRSLAWLRDPAARRLLAVYGVVLGIMNLLFYVALRGLPLGIAVAIEFLGPLSVAILASRRAVDFAWAALAVAGLALLLPLPEGATPLDPVSVAAALGAAAAWALYIVFGQRLSRAPGVDARHAVALGMVIASVVAIPAGVATAGSALLDARWWPLALAVALLSSAIPYPLEMRALRQLPARTFGILMSLEPALAALAGYVLLGEHLTALQGIAIGSVMLASAGATVTARGELHA